MTEIYDVAMLGLGAMGSAALYQLARRGAHVIGIDRHRPPHALGSTHGESRITRRAIGEGLAYVPLVSRSHEIWRELEAQTGERLLHEVGCLIVSRADDSVERPGRTGFIQRTRLAAERHDIAHEILSAADIRRRFPQFAASDDEIGYFEPGAGYVAPEKCVAVQLALAETLGAESAFDTAITRIESHDDGIALHGPADTIRARRLVLAAGAGAAGLLGPAFEPLLRPTRQTMHWFAIEPGWAEIWAKGPSFIWPYGDAADDFFYGFPQIGGVGAIKVADENDGPAIDPDHVDRLVPKTHSAAIFERHLRSRIRGISSERVDAVTCLYTTTPDNGFVIDRHPDDARILIVSPCSGHGFKHSAAIGEAAAEIALRGTSTIDLSAFALSRLTKL